MPEHHPIENLRRQATEFLKAIRVVARVDPSESAYKRFIQAIDELKISDEQLLGERAWRLVGRLQTRDTSVDVDYFEDELVKLLKYLKPTVPQKKRGRKSKYVELAAFVLTLKSSDAEENWQAWFNRAKEKYPTKTKMNLKAFTTGVLRRWEWEREQEENSTQ